MVILFHAIGEKVIVAMETDIIEIELIKQAIEKCGKILLQRVFTEAKSHYCENKSTRFQHYADHFVAKEVVLKALGTGWANGVGWKQIEIRSNKFKFGAPKLLLTGSTEEICDKMGVCNTLTSISH